MRAPSTPRARRRQPRKGGSGLLVVLVVGAFLGAVIASALAESGDLSVPPPPTTTTPTAPEPEAAGEPEPEREARSGGAELAPEHDAENHTEAPPLPRAEGAASAAGEPERVARAFAEAWINRPTDERELRRQNRRLVALSRGFWADNLATTLEDGGGGRGSRGSVVDVEFVRREGASIVGLVTTREQLAPDGEPLEPYHYALYLARLERASGGFAVSSWEPQF